jgi:hypothetical protein
MRTVRDIIDQAIAENRVPEYLLYLFAVLFVLTGELLIGDALYTKSGVAGILGVALNGLAWPAYRATRSIRAENLMLRMLEVPLTKARTAEEAARMITEMFENHFKQTSKQDSIGVVKVKR